MADIDHHFDCRHQTVGGDLDRPGLIGDAYATILQTLALQATGVLASPRPSRRRISAAARAGAVLLQFIVSIIIAGALLVYAQSGTDAVVKVTARLVGKEGGEKLAAMAGATIRSVAQGVLGVAVIQAVPSWPPT